MFLFPYSILTISWTQIYTN